MFKLTAPEWWALMQRVREDPETGCWEWQGARDQHGYGVVRFRGSLQRVHRLTLGHHLGRLPDPMALHKCDNPSCCRPDHLYEGDAKQNAQDAIAAGSLVGRPTPRGEQHGNARLTAAEVRRIRASTQSAGLLAHLHHISLSHIYRIRQRRAWAHLED